MRTAQRTLYRFPHRRVEQLLIILLTMSLSVAVGLGIASDIAVTPTEAGFSVQLRGVARAALPPPGVGAAAAPKVAGEPVGPPTSAGVLSAASVLSSAKAGRCEALVAPALGPVPRLC